MVELGALTPGVNSISTRSIGDGYTNLAIRGVTDRHGTTTGIYLDDSAVPPAQGDTYLRSFPVTFDLDRVEILRGPQGTLLGDNTQGGAIRFITNPPSLTTFTNLARAEFAATARGDQSYELGAVAGGPLRDNVLGFRMSGWYRSDGGYVDRIDPSTGALVTADSNRFSTRSVRGALLLAPADDVRITASLNYQAVDINDGSQFASYLSDPEPVCSGTIAVRAQPVADTFYLAALKLTAALGAGELTAVTSYFDRTFAGVEVGFPPPRDVVTYADAIRHLGDQHMWSQEVRLTSVDPDAPVTWLAGVFYSTIRTSESDGSVVVPDPDYGNTTTTEQSQFAGFGQVTVKLSKRATASGGARIERAQYDSHTEAPPVFHAADSELSVTPQFVVSFQADDHNLLYARVAQGHSPGGVYAALTVCGGNAQSYAPDTLWSYEIGAKDDLVGGRVHLDSQRLPHPLEQRPTGREPLRKCPCAGWRGGEQWVRVRGTGAPDRTRQDGTGGCLHGRALHRDGQGRRRFDGPRRRRGRQPAPGYLTVECRPGPLNESGPLVTASPSACGPKTSFIATTPGRSTAIILGRCITSPAFNRIPRSASSTYAPP